MDQWQDFPVIPGGHAVTAAGATRLLEDGAIENGQLVHVTCSILEPAPYAFMGRIRIGQFPQEREIGVGVTISAGVPERGGLDISVSDLTETYGSGLPDLCTFTPAVVDISARRVAGTFVCGTFDGARSKDLCKAGDSFFVFENCDR